MKTNLTPVTTDPQIMRVTGDRPYREGDRLIARDLAAGGIERECTFGAAGDDGKGKTYMVLRYGDEPFLEAFIATVGDVIEDLPDNNIEAIERWLEEES